MKLLTLSVSVFLVFQRAFHCSEYHRAGNTIDIFLFFLETTPMSSSTTFYVPEILNGFHNTFFHGFLLKEIDVMFSSVLFQRQQ